MKVTRITRINRDDYRTQLEILIDGETAFDVADGEPEDSNLSRDFNSCYKIPELMRKAYEAGKNGETFEIEETEEDWE